MTHDTAVRTIVALVPEIEKKGAEAVLLDHAEGENLPPAQLEKLAQVFNTLRTIDHIDKQANTDARGDSVPLLDVPVLVATYIVRTNQEKAAAPLASRHSSHDPGTVDLMSVVKFDPQIAKAAAAPAVEARKPVSKEALSEAALDLSLDARDAMEKIAIDLLTKLPSTAAGTLDMRDAVADARPVCNAGMLSQSIEWLKSASRKTLVNAGLAGDLTKRAFAHMGEAGRLLVAFNEEFATYQMLRKVAATGSATGGLTAQEQAEMVASMTDEEIDAFNTEHGVNLRDYLPEPETEETETPSPTRPPFVADNGDTEEAAGGGSGGGQGGSNANRSSGTAAPPAAATSNPRMEKILKSIGAPLRAAGKAVSDTSAYAQTQIDRVVNKDRTNKDQLNTDVDVEDIRRAIGIRRMIGTDPVLRESDPREVLEIYNAISRTNPEIVHNMPALRLLLREAVSYEGLTLDSQKQLTDIRSSSGKAEAQEADNLKRRYTISGGDGGKSKTIK